MTIQLTPLHPNGLLEPQYFRNQTEANLFKSSCNLMGMQVLEDIIPDSNQVDYCFETDDIPIVNHFQ